MIPKIILWIHPSLNYGGRNGLLYIKRNNTHPSSEYFSPSPPPTSPCLFSLPPSFSSNPFLVYQKFFFIFFF
uniref:Candidate secreted effector n=1 Tax=Meloidogyne incognita TaxID=6306 RepID=A0A914L6P0_MELIC